MKTKSSEKKQYNCELKALWVPIIVDNFIVSNEMVGNNEIKDFNGFINELKNNNKQQKPMLFKGLDYFSFLLKKFGEEYSASITIQIKERSCFTSFFKTNKIHTGSFIHHSKEIEQKFKYKIIASEKHINLDILTFEIQENQSDDRLIVTLDCYGFIFISRESHDNSYKNIQLMSNQIIRSIHELLTDPQIELLEKTILNTNFEFNRFAENNTVTNNNTSKIRKFISKIIVNTYEYEPALNESLLDSYIIDNYGKYCFSGTYDENISSKYLQKRTYSLPCLAKKVDNENITNNNRKWLYQASLQDRVETLSMERFLSVSTSQNYSERIIQNITAVREGLVSKIVFLTENMKTPGLSDIAKEVSRSREEKIERYVEYVVSESTSFQKLNKLLRNAFYYKIGNTSYFNTVNAEETIDKLSSYNYWESVLKTLTENISGLKTILYLYHNKRSLAEMHDFNYRKASDQDNKLVQHALGNNNEQSFSVSVDDKKYFTFLSFLIAGATLIATIVPYGTDPSAILLLLTLYTFFGVFLFKIFGLKTIFKLFNSNEKWKNTPFSHINYRSKHSLVEALGKGTKLHLDHSDGDDFISNTLNIVQYKTFWSHGKEVKLIPDKLMSIATINVISEREHPHKRRINISFTYSPTEEEYLKESTLSNFFDSNSDKKERENITNEIVSKLSNISKKIKEQPLNDEIKIYPHFIVVYSFDLRDETGNKFYIYKNSIRSSYSLRYDSNKINKLINLAKGEAQKTFNEIDVLFGRVLYLAYIKPFHSEQNKDH